MSTEFISHFYLERGDAIEIIAGMLAESPASISDLAATSHRRAFLPPLVTKKVTSEDLNYIRRGVLALAEEQGFPNRNAMKCAAMSKFDVEVGNFLFGALKISPADASREETWNFLTLVLLPDVAYWRYPNPQEKPDFERWLGKPRNVFRKAWWRAYVLGQELNGTLGEDEGVGIMERPTFGMNPALARAIARTHRDLSPKYRLSRSDLLRLVMVHLGKLCSIINLDALTAYELDKLVKETYTEIADRLGSPWNQSELVIEHS